VRFDSKLADVENPLNEQLGTLALTKRRPASPDKGTQDRQLVMLTLTEVFRDFPQSLGKCQGITGEVGARPVLDGARPALDRARPALDRARPSLDRARPAIDRARPALDRARPAPFPNKALIFRRLVYR